MASTLLKNDILGYFGVYWDILGYFGIYWDILGNMGNVETGRFPSHA